MQECGTLYQGLGDDHEREPELTFGDKPTSPDVQYIHVMASNPVVISLQSDKSYSSQTTTCISAAKAPNRITNMAGQGAGALQGAHPIAIRIEEKLRSSLKIEHFVSRS